MRQQLCTSQTHMYRENVAVYGEVYTVFGYRTFALCKLKFGIPNLVFVVMFAEQASYLQYNLHAYETEMAYFMASQFGWCSTCRFR